MAPSLPSHFRAVHRGHRDPGRMGDRRAALASARKDARRSLSAHVQADVGRTAGPRVHFRARVHLQFLGHGDVSRVPVLQGWRRLRRDGANPRMDRRRAVESNTSTNAMFGAFQALVGKILGLPALLLPTLKSVGAEVGKPVAPQTASVGVATSRYVRNEGAVIRHNMGWTFVLLAYLILIGILFYVAFPGVMSE